MYSQLIYFSAEIICETEHKQTSTVLYLILISDFREEQN